MLTMLIGHGADIDTHYKDLTHLAIRNGYFDIARYLKDIHHTPPNGKSHVPESPSTLSKPLPRSPGSPKSSKSPKSSNITLQSLEAVKNNDLKEARTLSLAKRDKHSCTRRSGSCVCQREW